MPVLALPDLNNPLGMYLAQLAVRAVMAWPTDKAARRQYVTAALAHHLGELEAAKDELPDFAEAADWFEAIAAVREHEEWHWAQDTLESWFRRSGGFAAVAAASSVTAYQELMTKQLGDQFAAGLVLALVRRMAIHPNLPGGPSVNKAIFLLEQVRAPRVPRNEFQLRRAWATYKPVAHFCAALFDWFYETLDEADGPGDFAVRMEQRLLYGFDAFLALAEAYQNFGLSFRPARAKSWPLLDPLQTWVLPTERQWEPTPMVAAPLTDFLLSVLRNYRAPSAY